MRSVPAPVLWLGMCEVPSTVKGSGIRVSKLGGSLLSLPDFPTRVRARLSEANLCEPLATLLIVGGGELIDAVRRLDSLHGFDAGLVHDECIGLLSCTARLVHQQFPEFDYIASEGELQRFIEVAAHSRGGFAIVDVKMVMPRIEATVELPKDWTTTTDSISAGLAIAIVAKELLIFKSTEPPEHREDHASNGIWLAALAREAFIDEALPGLATKLPTLRFENLRR